MIGDFRFKTDDSPKATGAFGKFSADGETYLAAAAENRISSISNRIAFYASQSSTVYSSDSSINTVQPPAAQVLMIIKA